MHLRLGVSGNSLAYDARALRAAGCRRVCRMVERRLIAIEGVVQGIGFRPATPGRPSRERASLLPNRRGIRRSISLKVDPGSEARSRHSALTTIALTGAAASSSAVAGFAAPDFHFAVPSHDPCIVQDTHEMLYHVLWELVHVLFDHRT